ncbi:hypothetical protein AU106_gp134 [Sinorhizobium phage phiM9]|uniref:Uncharacterized protein n=1 Tax=Sinorhizobium phage phiM9 TaxID=1636182 RepID=A0A0F6R5Y6_9CAUD|nr:hypothetical protein AU106_gp134 [Sinorhizobium phage phiM9]AKE44765.1 hypothetical protein Sm_phiM9_137 [Sinorhizobium phage phiM9]
MAEFRLNSVTRITEGDEEGSYWFVDCNVTIVHDNGTEETFDAFHVQRHEDKQGFCVPIKAWMEENPEFPIEPYSPKVFTPEELREQMPALSAKQFRLGLVSDGYSPSQVDTIINSMPDGPTKEAAKIEWEYATTFKRTHSLIETISQAMGITPEQVDAMWESSKTL